jgi:hypothetical protein
MTVCPACGHPATTGRFCTRCGAPLDQLADGGVSDTAERPAVPHTSPADAPPPPLPPPTASSRYPLFADEAPPATATADLPVMPRPEPAPAAVPEEEAGRRARPAWPVWALAAAVLVVVIGLGVWLLGGDDDAARAGGGDRSGGTSGAGGEPVDLARGATALVPAEAPPNQDVEGNLVRYEARQMLDGVPSTCWRMPGDGTGEVLVFRLEKPTALSEVGLINGYAKTAQDGGRTFDWYAGNRRVLAVEWTFDDGTTVTQELTETRDLQTVEVDTTTQSVEMRLVEVSPPGAGPSGRDYTAVSEVSLVGVPG